jgi:hypothetical protein
MTNRNAANDWVARYERAWRAPGVEALAALFDDAATYLTSPWATPILGLGSLRRFWDAARTGPDDGFDMTSEIVAVEESTAVVRVHVHYADGERWRDLWLVELNDEGRCDRFEEWPFAPDQDDGNSYPDRR